MRTIKGEVSNAGGSVEYINNLSGVPAPAPFFSQAVLAGDTVYFAGLIAIDPTTNKLVDGGIGPETERIFDNIQAALDGVGLGFNDVAKVSVYLTDISDLAAMNEIYLRRFGKARPAREMMAVKGLAFGAKVEITVTAYRGR